MSVKSKQPSLGPPPKDAAGQLRWLTQMQELVETAHGQRGDGKRAFVERQDLVGLNLADWEKSGYGKSGGTNKTVNLVTKVMGGGGDSAVDGDVVDYDPPRPVKNVVAIGDEENDTKIVVIWDITGIDHYGGAEIYRGGTSNFDSTVEKVGKAGVGQRIFVDTINGRNKNQSVYYWVKSTKTTNTMTSALNQTAGTLAVFDPDQQKKALSDAALEGYRVMVGVAADEVIADNMLATRLVVSDTIQSDDYIPGRSGWILKK